MTPRVKICGITTEDAVEAAQGADYLGFVFYPPSPRNITPSKAAALAARSPLAKVAVTVNPNDDFLATILTRFTPDYIQLHGDESVARVQHIKERFNIPLVKAFTIASGDDITAAYDYESVADMLLFDAKAPKGLPGGNGVAFDWKLLTCHCFNKPWFLSGGIHAGNVEEALRASGALMVDVSSGLESKPGMKDPARMRDFLKKAKNLSL